LALQECGRKLGTYLRKRQKMKREGQRRDIFERYIGEISRSCNALTGVDTQELYDALLRQAKRRTEMADVELDEEGKVVDTGNGRLDDDDGVIIVDRDGPEGPGGGGPGASGATAGPEDEPDVSPARKKKRAGTKSGKRSAKAAVKKKGKSAPKRSGSGGSGGRSGGGKRAKARTHKKVGKPRVRVELQPGGLFE
jgi:hypothetical protein